MTHEDARRKLTDWPEAKIIEVKQDCVLGNHYHKIKTERFILVAGKGLMVVDGVSTVMEIGKMYTVLPLQFHTFVIDMGSVLVGLCSHVFDPKDDYLTPEYYEL